MTEEKKTWKGFALEIAAEYGVHLTDKQVEILLWGGTAFPFAKPEVVERQIREAFDPLKSNPDLTFDQLMEKIQDDIDREMEEHRRRQAEQSP